MEARLKLIHGWPERATPLDCHWRRNMHSMSNGRFDLNGMVAGMGLMAYMTAMHPSRIFLAGGRNRSNGGGERCIRRCWYHLRVLLKRRAYVAFIRWPSLTYIIRVQSGDCVHDINNTRDFGEWRHFRHIGGECIPPVITSKPNLEGSLWGSFWQTDVLSFVEDIVMATREHISPSELEN